MDQELVLKFASPAAETETAAAAVPSPTKPPPPPPPPQPSLAANPRPDQLKICIVGDSGLQLNKSKGTAGFETDIRAILGPNTDVVRFPGEGAATITRWVQSKRSEAHAVVVVWFLNELFTTRWTLVEQYPARMDGLAQGLAAALKDFPYRAAVIGGGACLWRVSGQFDTWADRVRTIVRSQGIHVVDGLDAYSGLELTDDHWHARSTPANKARLASYFAKLVWQIVDMPLEPHF